MNIYQGHEFVDLGLPSGTLWATCNVGAVNSEEFGSYFAWGETNPKFLYDWNTYKYCNGHFKKLTKYCNKRNYGNNTCTDLLTNLQDSDDAATANWGKGWQTPTKEQWEELLLNSKFTKTIRNGVEGKLFEANGNSIFLPAAGYRWDNELFDIGSYGGYWSRSLDLESPDNAWYYYFDSIDCIDVDCRFGGFSVRPVHSVKCFLTTITIKSPHHRMAVWGFLFVRMRFTASQDSV